MYVYSIFAADHFHRRQWHTCTSFQMLTFDKCLYMYFLKSNIRKMWFLYSHINHGEWGRISWSKTGLCMLSVVYFQCHWQHNWKTGIDRISLSYDCYSCPVGISSRLSRPYLKGARCTPYWQCTKEILF